MNARRFAWERAHGIDAPRFLIDVCGRRDCVNPMHLKGATKGEALTQCIRRKRFRTSRLNEKKVLTIRRRLARGETRRSICEAFKLSYDAVMQIHLRQTWAWVLG